MITKLKTAPAVEPVSLAEAKLYLRVDSSAEEATITSMIVAARSHVEAITGRALVTQTWYGWLDAFPGDSGQVVLPFGQAQTLTSFAYTDIDATSTDVDSDTYDLDSESDPGRIILKYGETWPSVTLATKNPILIEWVCGYGLAVAVPDDIKLAIKWIVADMFENRGPQANPTTLKHVYTMLGKYRMWGY